jgi:hypothetical protein
MRVMIFTPYADRLEKATIDAVVAMQRIGPQRWVLQYDNPYGPSRASHLHQYAKGRELFLGGDDEAMLIIESDIIPPPDTLKRLRDLNADLAYGVYCFRTERRARRAINIFNRYKPWPEVTRNEGESLSTKGAELRMAIANGVTECSGAGFGCVLIKRNVIEEIEFRLEDTGHCDTYFTRDAYRAGYKIMADMNLVCGHVDTDGVVLWPLGYDDESKSYSQLR